MMVMQAEHLMLKVWEAYCNTDEFKNSLEWAVRLNYDDGQPISDLNRENHAKGAMWLAFTKGFEVRYGS